MTNLSSGRKKVMRVVGRDDDRGPPRWTAPSGPELKRMREDLGLTQEAFAERFGINLVSLRKWEQGRSEPEQINCMLLRMIQADQKSVQGLIDKAKKKGVLVDS